MRGQHSKETAQLDARLRDGGAAFSESRCTWRETAGLERPMLGNQAAP
jgi:hypothetical protein